tara:strand:+ start:757 stop:1245 length:489 start_codon:yes stop_codon:yes gene_type:complete
MYRYLSLFLFIYLVFGQSSNQKANTQNDNNKLSIIEYSKFNWRLFKKIQSWYPTIGDGNKISMKEFFIITESNEERNLITQNEKNIIKLMTMAALSTAGGLVLILTPETKEWGVYLGLGPLIISEWLMIKANTIISKPVISYESAKNIADQYNKNLHLKNQN